MNMDMNTIMNTIMGTMDTMAIIENIEIHFHDKSFKI